MREMWALLYRFIPVVVLVGVIQAPAAQAAPGVYSFTTAGSSGINGPTQESVTASYSGTTLAGQVVVQTRGIQQWTVPATDTYSVTAAGASGGYVTGKIGGRGRVITAQIYLTQGQIIKILIGQEGGRSAFSTGGGGAAGGGGGTFIVDSATSSALLIVGGGGGGAQSKTGLINSGGSNGLDASAFNVTAGVAGTGGGAAGTLGGGGVSTGSWCAGGGGGFSGDGSTWNTTFGVGGKSFSNGGVAGANYATGTTLNIPGGFGGGGGALAMDNYETNGGGGGGYSGGGCGRNAQNTGGGGGGGNFYTGIYISNSLNTGNGYATFSRMNLQAAQITLSANTSTTTRDTSVLTATSTAAGEVTFFANGKRIAGCIRVKTQTSGLNNVATCNWKPSVRGSSTVTVQITPSTAFGPGSSQPINISVAGRSGRR